MFGRHFQIKNTFQNNCSGILKECLLLNGESGRYILQFTIWTSFHLTSMSEWCLPLIKMKKEWKVSPEKSIWVFYWWEKWIGERGCKGGR